MGLSAPAAARCLLVALLMLVLPLAGAGRVAAWSAAGSLAPDAHWPICQARGHDNPSSSLPSAPRPLRQHGCCDVAGPCAAAATPGRWEPSIRIAHRLAAIVGAARPVPTMARARTPRLAQGPPPG